MAGGKEQERADNGSVEGGDAVPFAAELNALTAEELARRSQQGCRASFGELVERYGLRLFRFLRHQTNNIHDAEDLVQDTFARAYANIERYRNTYKFSTWLFTIARNLACSRLRRQHRNKPVLPAKPAEPGPSEKIVQREMRQGLWAAAQKLSPNQYQALWLKYAEDMPIREIAKVMCKSQVSVKVTLCRARMRLAEKFQDIAAAGKENGKASLKETLALMKVEGA